MNKKVIFTALLALAVVAGQAQEKQIVWEQPTTEYGNSYGDGFFNLVLDVTKVELKTDETVVYITAQRRSDYPEASFQFVSDTYLKAGDQRYTLISADGIELNKFVQTNKDGRREIVFHFPPLPKDTKSFDFIEGDDPRAFQIKGIKPVEERWKQLFPSYWRNAQGDWKIAFFEDFAIYDCRFWNYEQCNVNHKSGEADIVMRNGNDVLKVKVGKDKKGTRTIQVGSQKAAYAMITSRFLPDYPTKDTRTEFVDNGYKTDTVTVVGWLKDMPEYYKSLETFDFSFENLFTGEEESVEADLDELGRFSVKIPIRNSTEFFCDWDRCFIRTMLEPDKTYFLLYDFKEGRRFFMGDDCRLQNELFKYPLDWESISLYKRLNREDKATPEQFDQYIVSVDSLIKTQYAKIDALCEQHPTLSARFNRYRKGNTLMRQARDFGQARFCVPKFQLPDDARRYAYDTFWTKIEQPYTLHRSISGFLCDYLDDAIDISTITFNWNAQDYINEFSSNDEELALLTRWKSWVADGQAQIEAVPTEEEKVRLAEKLNADNADLLKDVAKIVNGPKAKKFIDGQLFLIRINKGLQVLDSLGTAPFIKEVWLTREVLGNIDDQRTSLAPAVLDTLRTIFSTSDCFEMIEKVNAKYVAWENNDFANAASLRPSSDVEGMSDGEKILRKIIEPYKGRIIYVDIWGTWCGPCKEALKESHKLKEALKDYDIVYLYLANRSSDESWKNVIKEYDLTGEDCVHYNLPSDQQRAIERYIGINGYPTYKLIDKEGNIYDLDWRHYEDLNNFREIIAKFSE